MKKIFLFISPLIAFFLGGFILSFNCNAQAMPTPSSNTLTLIEGGNSALSYDTFSTIDVLPFNRNPTELNRIIGVASGNPLLEGINLNTIGIEDYEIRRLSPTEIKSIQDSNYNTFYNASGHEVDLEDVYYMHYENSMFHGDLYIDTNGDILTTDLSNTYNAFKLGLGGTVLGITDIANIYNLISNELQNQQYNYSLNGEDLSNVSLSYYLHAGYVNNRGTLKYEWYVYAPNIYNVGVSVGSNYENGRSIGNIYFSDNSIQYGNIINTCYSVGGPVNQDGINYQHNFSQNYYIDGQNNNRTNFDNNVGGRYNFSLTNFTYNPNLKYTYQDVVSFKKLNPLPSTKLIQIEDDYDYNYIKELETSLNNTINTVNGSFDPSTSISPNNYPIVYNSPSSTPDTNPSELPFPQVQNNPMPDPETAPSIGSDIGEVDPTELRSTIPVINNLLNRFPFSIPWDIYGLLSGLSVERQTPYINTTIHIPCINYDWVLDYDLSDFDGIASLFRTLFLIAFILGLAYFSYDHFFGS